MADGPTRRRRAHRLTIRSAPTRRWRELPVLVGAAVLLAIAIKLIVVQAFSIPSASMVPTLIGGDRILVCRICLRFDDVDRGDVIVFEVPDAATPIAASSAEPCTGSARPWAWRTRRTRIS